MDDIRRTVVGIDPGTRQVGYGVIKMIDRTYRVMDSGVFQFPSQLPTEKRLVLMFDELMDLLNYAKVGGLSVEEPHVRPWGMKSALSVAQSVGVVKLAAAKAGVPVFSYPYTQVKRTLTGSGSASRFILSEAVKRILNLPEVPPWQDAIDALALALCHCLLSPVFEKAKQLR